MMTWIIWVETMSPPSTDTSFDTGLVCALYLIGLVSISLGVGYRFESSVGGIVFGIGLIFLALMVYLQRREDR